MDGFKRLLEDAILGELSKTHDILSNRKHGKVSTLMTKGISDLRTLDLTDIIVELASEFPLLAKTFLAFMVPERTTKQVTSNKILPLIPRIGLLYAILCQGRNKELSLVQRLIDVLLFDNLCDKKVFDRLQPLGLCLSYNQGLNLLDKFAGQFSDTVIQALKSGKRIRLIGDNINWKTGVHDERKDNHPTWHHAFGSAVIVQNIFFNSMSNVKPQIPLDQASIDLFLPSSEDWDHIKYEYAVLMFKVVVKHVPYFEKFTEAFPKVLKGQYSEQLRERNQVIPLPVLHYNEQNYEDVVKIMDYYEQFLGNCFREAGVSPDTKVHVGGDQLTRERFSGAKRLRSSGDSPTERFEHLSPITFELFHMLMNYLKMMYSHLSNTDSLDELGTMGCEANRVYRNLNGNINENYDSHRDFCVSFTDSYIVEAVLDFFGMDNVNSAPTKQMPGESIQTKEDQESWIQEKFKEIVNCYVLNEQPKKDPCVQEDGVVVPVKLANGTTKILFIRPASTKPVEDRMKNYSHLVLELGLHFKSLLDLCRTPDRDRGLRLLKVAMVHFKSSNNLSKYASEIMRLLVHQQVILSEKEALEEFYGLFVNTKGSVDGHIPGDLQMEYIVKEVKNNIKHMFSNKTKDNITVRTSALSLIKEISKNFDEKSNVLVRCRRHTDLDAASDEREIIQDLRRRKPFKFHAGRVYDSFKNVQSSVGKTIDVEHFHTWIRTQTYKFATELGN